MRKIFLKNYIKSIFIIISSLFLQLEKELIYNTRADKNKNHRNFRHDRTQSNFLRNYQRPCRHVPRVPKSRDYSLKSTRNPKSATSYSFQTQKGCVSA